MTSKNKEEILNPLIELRDKTTDPEKLKKIGFAIAAINAACDVADIIKDNNIGGVFNSMEAYEKEIVDINFKAWGDHLESGGISVTSLPSVNPFSSTGKERFEPGERILNKGWKLSRSGDNSELEVNPLEVDLDSPNVMVIESSVSAITQSIKEEE